VTSHFLLISAYFCLFLPFLLISALPAYSTLGTRHSTPFGSPSPNVPVAPGFLTILAQGLGYVPGFMRSPYFPGDVYVPEGFNFRPPHCKIETR